MSYLIYSNRQYALRSKREHHVCLDWHLPQQYREWSVTSISPSMRYTIAVMYERRSNYSDDQINSQMHETPTQSWKTSFSWSIMVYSSARGIARFSGSVAGSGKLTGIQSHHSGEEEYHAIIMCIPSTLDSKGCAFMRRSWRGMSLSFDRWAGRSWRLMILAPLLQDKIHSWGLEARMAQQIG